jgi:hypothetical protein
MVKTWTLGGAGLAAGFSLQEAATKAKAATARQIVLFLIHLNQCRATQASVKYGTNLAAQEGISHGMGGRAAKTTIFSASF